MNFYMYFYLICIAVAASNFLLTAVLLFLLKKAGNIKANRVLSIVLLLLGVSFLSDVLWTKHFFDYYPHLFDYDTPMGLCIGPLVYLYIRYQINPQTRLQPSDLLHLLPLVLYIWLLQDFLFSNASDKLKMIHNLAIPNFFLVQYLKKAQLLLYGLVCYRFLARHKRVTYELLSNLENRHLQWLKHLLLATGVLLGLWVISNEFIWTQPALGITLLAFSYWIAYQALQQESSFANIATQSVLPIINEEPAGRYRNSSLSDEYLKEAMDRIEQYMTNEKPYLNGDMNLTSLAEQLAFSPNQLSQILNEGFRENFYRLVNRYRIEESKRLLLDPAFEHYNIMGIAFEAGFSTKSTFNKTFKELTGLSPSEFLKQHRSINYLKP
ncbi:MAG TPA: helix-turn-helix domain-containing protein [Flavobacterium sp.]